MVLLGACGLAVVGTLDEDGAGDAVTSPANDAADDDDAAKASDDGGFERRERDATGEDPASEAGDGGGPSDARNDADAASPTDAASDVAPLPADAGPPTALVISGRFWRYDLPSDSWSGGQQLPTGNCPALDDVAVDAYGAAYGVGNNGTTFHRVNTANVTCSQIGAAGTFPKATTFALRGTVAANVEVLVGYQDNGDYVRIDTATGAVSTITAGALAGFTIGDVVNVGLKGYVVLSGGVCGGASCLWEVSLASGTRVGASPIGNFPSGPVKGLAHWAGRLYGFVDADQVYRADPANPAGATALGGVPGYVDVHFRGAGSSPAAPTQ